MYKFLILLLLTIFQMRMLAVQLDEEIAMHTLFEMKHGVNRAAHAAAQQLDELMLSEGIWTIDEERAWETALSYLQANLRLNEDNAPLPGSHLRTPVEVVVFEVIGADYEFPYRYMNNDYGYEVTLSKPGVILMIRVEYPRIFSMIEPIVWTVKGAAELYKV